MVSLACLSACVKVPEFKGRDAGGGSGNDDAAIDANIPTGVSATATPNGTACATGNGFQLGMGWRTGHSTRARLPQGAVAGGTIAFIENLSNPGATSMLANNFEAASQTTWFAAATSTCTDVRAQVAPYQANSAQPLPTLTIQSGTGTPDNFGVALDGIFGGETAQATAGGSGFPDNVLTLTTPTPLAGFALWLNVDAGAEIASVRKSPAEPATSWYSVQTPPGSPTQRGSGSPMA